MEEISLLDSFNTFKPESCVFVLSVDVSWKPSWMVAGRNMKCSETPFLFAVSLSKKNYTHSLIQQSKEFVVAVPNKSLEDTLLLFWTTHGNDIDKFQASNIRTLPAKYIKTPLIEDATINYECRLFREIDIWNHIIFVWEVLTAYMSEDKKVLLNMGKINGKRIFEEF